jgi:hypothetical protein
MNLKNFSTYREHGAQAFLFLKVSNESQGFLLPKVSMNLQQFIIKVSIKPRVFIHVSMGIDYSDPLGVEHEPQAPQPQHLHCPTLQMKGR